MSDAVVPVVPVDGGSRGVRRRRPGGRIYRYVSLSVLSPVSENVGFAIIYIYIYIFRSLSAGWFYFQDMSYELIGMRVCPNSLDMCPF